MENSNDPDRSSALTRAIDQSNECEEGLSDHSPVWDETVGYEPALRERNGISSNPAVESVVYSRERDRNDNVV
jgi:hypothetical protein